MERKSLEEIFNPQPQKKSMEEIFGAMNVPPQDFAPQSFGADESFDFGEQPPEKYTPQFSGFFGGLERFGETLGQFGIGMEKGGLSTVRGTGEKMLGGGLKTILPKKAESAFGLEKERTGAEELIPESMVTPERGAQKAGFLTEQIAEYFIPAAKAAKSSSSRTASR